MKKRKIGFLLILLGIILLAGCENSLTGTNIDGESNSRAATSQAESSDRRDSKVVTETVVKDMVYIFSSGNNPLDAIGAGYYHYYYTDDEGYRGSLTSYNYALLSAPQVYNSYILYPDTKIYYKGTVYK